MVWIWGGFGGAASRASCGGRRRSLEDFPNGRFWGDRGGGVSRARGRAPFLVGGGGAGRAAARLAWRGAGG